MTATSTFRSQVSNRLIASSDRCLSDEAVTALDVQYRAGHELVVQHHGGAGRAEMSVTHSLNARIRGGRRRCHLSLQPAPTVKPAMFSARAWSGRSPHGSGTRRLFARFACYNASSPVPVCRGAVADLDVPHMPPTTRPAQFRRRPCPDRGHTIDPQPLQVREHTSNGPRSRHRRHHRSPSPRWQSGKGQSRNPCQIHDSRAVDTARVSPSCHMSCVRPQTRSYGSGDVLPAGEGQRTTAAQGGTVGSRLESERHRVRVDPSGGLR